MYLLVKQQQVARQNLDRRVFLDGVAGTGKTTAGIERVKQLLHAGAPPASILVLVPQQATGLPWQDALRRSRAPGGAEVRVTTLGSLARELLELFWPLIAADTGCADALAPPRFPGLEAVAVPDATLRRRGDRAAGVFPLGQHQPATGSIRRLWTTSTRRPWWTFRRSKSGRG